MKQSAPLPLDPAIESYVRHRSVRAGLRGGTLALEFIINASLLSGARRSQTFAHVAQLRRCVARCLRQLLILIKKRKIIRFRTFLFAFFFHTIYLSHISYIKLFA